MCIRCDQNVLPKISKTGYKRYDKRQRLKMATAHIVEYTVDMQTSGKIEFKFEL
jgi:hypothetical protein